MDAQVVLLVVFGLAVLMVAAALFFFMSIFHHWLRALLAGVSLTPLDVLLMRLRRLPVHTVVDSLILARHSHVELSPEEAQVAVLKGVDLTKVTLALIEARRRGLDVTFAELVENELRGRLSTLLAEEPAGPVGTGEDR